MNGELLNILDSIERDKGIDREILIQAVEAALVSAARKTVGSETAEVEVKIDRQTGRISIISQNREVQSGDFGRIAAQAAKQVIIQKIREAEREVIFNEFQGKVGDIVTGAVHRFERGDVIVEVGRAEALLPRQERIPREDYRQGDRLQAYVAEVTRTPRGPQIVLSRAHPGFIKGLFELEVPEIMEGIVEIHGIAREAGDRTKIAVSSKDSRVDCVGACVGMRGTRVKDIVRELHGEKIDIVRWHLDTATYIAAALSPANVAELRLNNQEKRAVVIVDDDQLSLAIGKKGQNVRLASKLTGWELDIATRTQLRLQKLPPLEELPGVGPVTATRLKDAGFATSVDVAKATIETLTAVKGIGKATATKLLAGAQQALEAAGISLASLTAPQETSAGGTEAEATQTTAGPGGEPGTEEVSEAASGGAGADQPPSVAETAEPTEEPEPETVTEEMVNAAAASEASPPPAVEPAEPEPPAASEDGEPDGTSEAPAPPAEDDETTP